MSAHSDTTGIANPFYHSDGSIDLDLVRKRRNSVGSNIPTISKLSNTPKKKKKSKSTVAISGHILDDSLRSTFSTTNTVTGNTFLSRNINNSTNFNNNNIKKDLRPLRDKNYQNAIQQEIIDYLLECKFDIDMNLPISLKTLRQPTQKSIMLIFKWLYQRLDPGYQFNKSIESELYQILKNLQYPYLETINKSQISAVGGSNWNKFLGCIHWLVKLNIKMDNLQSKLNQNLIDQPTLELIQIDDQMTMKKNSNNMDLNETTLNSIPDSLEEQDQIKLKYESLIETLVIEYTMEAYKMFLKNQDNFEPAMKNFQIGFDKFNRIIQLDINNLDKQNQIILKEYETMLDKVKNFRITKEKYTALQNDVNAFQKYINVMENKSKEWPKKLQKMEQDLILKIDQINDLEKQIRDILNQMDERQISSNDIEDKNKKYESFLQKLDQMSDQSDKLIANIQSKKMENKNVLKNLLNILNQYNYSIDVLLNRRLEITGRQVDNLDQYKLNIKDSLEQIDENSELSYLKLFNQKNEKYSMKTEKTNKLVELIEDIEKNYDSIQNDIKTLEDDILQLENKIKRENDVNENLKEQILALQNESHLQRQSLEKRINLQNVEINKLQERNDNAYATISDKLSDANTAVERKRKQQKELEKELNDKRTKLQQKLLQIVDHIVEFKLNVQNSLEETDKFVTDKLAKLNLDQ